MYLLSGHARRVATALRNVFKSESKEDSAKGKETGQGSKSLEQDSFTTNLQTVSGIKINVLDQIVHYH